MPPTITFSSKHRNLRITRRPHVEVATATGAFRTLDHPVRYQFQDRGGEGVLEVEAGQDQMPDGAPIIDPETGTARRDGNLPVFEMQDAVAFLRSLPEYNNATMIGGFTEVGREPDRIPDAGPRVREIISAMAELDVETLRRFAEEEEAAPYSREPVTAALAAALEQVEGARAALAGVAPVNGAAPAGTAENGAQESLGARYGDADGDLDAIDSMKALKAIGTPLGLTFPPGTSKLQARELIREAPGTESHPNPYKKG